MATDSKAIKYTATVDDNPFAAATRRMGEHLVALQQRWLGAGSSWGTTAEAMRGQMAAVTESVASGVTSMGGHFSGLLQALSGTAIGMGGLVVAAAGLGASKAVNATANLIESTMDLGRALGVTTNEARAWQLVLDDVGAQHSELAAAGKGMSRQLRENEEEMNALGLATRDAQGNLRPMTDLLLDGIGIINQYAEGADQAMVGQMLFGRGVDVSSRLLLVNREAMEEVSKEMRALGLEVGGNATSAWQKYDAASDAAARRIKAVAYTAGIELMPVMTDLTSLFNSVMPAAIVVVRGALGGLLSAVHLLGTGVRVVWETINAMVISVAEPLRAVVEALGRAMVGDFSGAAVVLKSVPGTISAAWSNAFDQMLASAEETSKRIGAMFMPDTTPGDTGKSKQDGKRLPKKTKDGDKVAAEGSDMPQFQNALEQVKLYYAQRDALRDFSKQQELDFWNEILANDQVKSKDRLAIQKKTAELQVAVIREKAKEAQQLGQIELAAWEASELAKVAASQQAAQQAVAMGEMTNADLLALEERLEQQRAAVKEAALRARLSELDPERDAVKVAELNSQLQALEQQHQLKLAQIRGQAARESAAEQRAVWEDLAQRIDGLWNAGVQAMMNGTLTWRNAVRAIGMELAGWFAGIVKRMVVTWVFGEEAKTTATQAGVMQRWLMESWAAAKSTALWAAAAVKNIMVSAWEAMAGAYKAIAGIPYVGPFLAPVMAGVAFAGVAGIARNIASAEGGFDIPRGVNPIVQLHEEEMVLPRDQANVIRDMAQGDGGGAPRGDLSVTFKGVGAGDFFMVNKRELAATIKSLYRDGMLRPA